VETRERKVIADNLNLPFGFHSQKYETFSLHKLLRILGKLMKSPGFMFAAAAVAAYKKFLNSPFTALSLLPTICLATNAAIFD
jgi:hypothetical protein